MNDFLFARVAVIWADTPKSAKESRRRKNKKERKKWIKGIELEECNEKGECKEINTK